MMIASTLAAALMMSGAPPVQNWNQNQNQRGAPRGSYAQSCSGAYVNQGRLYADCRDTRGGVRSTSIELARCSSSEIANDNGRLICGNVRGDLEDDRPGRPNRPGQPGGGWGGSGGGWGGSGARAITVYRDAEFRGPSQSFNREIENLADVGINDQISSIRLRGAWEVCVDAHFRGQCQIIERDARDLRPLGLNDRISSMRPARRGGGRW